jgi:outer membrane lipoprotein SlyB
MHRHATAVLIRLSVAFPLLAYGTLACAQTNVTYGKVTAVKPVSVENAQAQAAGAVVGGTLGLISGRRQSGSNKALRAAAGGVAGQQLAK